MYLAVSEYRGMKDSLLRFKRFFIYIQINLVKNYTVLKNKKRRKCILLAVEIGSGEQRRKMN